VLVIALVLNGEVQEGSNLELKAVRAIEKHQELRSGHLTDIGADPVREALLASVLIRKCSFFSRPEDFLW
jgi:hypothetical protein